MGRLIEKVVYQERKQQKARPRGVNIKNTMHKETLEVVDARF